jgi:serine/threonine protein kinase
MPCCVLMPLFAPAWPCLPLQVYAGTLHGALPVAIKVVDPAWLRLRPETFWREASVLQHCRHPSIVQLLGLYSGGVRQAQEEPQQQPEEMRPLCEEAASEQAVEKPPQGVMVVTELMPGGPLINRLADPDMRWYRRYAPRAMGACLCDSQYLASPYTSCSVPVVSHCVCVLAAVQGGSYRPGHCQRPGLSA